MKPLLMTLCGWGPYKNQVTIDFTKMDQNGLFLVTGPTGAGKTTIFDGIMYALYGRVSGDVREKESVRSDFCAPEDLTYVNLTFCHRDISYEINRNPKYMRPKKRGGETGDLVEEKEKAILKWKDGDTEHVVEGVGEVTKKVEEILCLDNKQFKQTTMIAQGEFTRLLFAPPKDKTLIFRNLFGTGIYELFVKKLKSEVNSLNGQVETLRNRMQEAVEMLSIEDADWAELMAGENHPYPQLLDFLKKYIKQLSKEEKEKQKELEAQIATQKEQEKVLNQAEEVEKRFQELTQARMVLEARMKEAEELEAVKKELSLGLTAAALLPALNSMEEKESRSKRLFTQKENYQRELDTVQKQVKQLLSYAQNEQLFLDFLKQLEAYGLLAQKLVEKEENWNQIKIKLSGLQQEFKRLEQEKNQEKALYEKLLEMRQHGAVGLVARELKAGMPCPVCGSLEHPHIAECADEIPDEKKVKSQKKRYEEAQKAFEKSLKETEGCYETEQVLKGQLEEEEKELDLQNKMLCKLIKANKDPISLLTKMQEAEVINLLGTGRQIGQFQKNWQKQFKDKQEAYAEAEKQKHSLQELYAVTQKELEEAVREEKQAGEAFEKACAEKLQLDFDSEETTERIEGYITQINRYKKEEKWLEKTQQRITDFSKEFAVAEETVKRLETVCSTLKRVDITLMLEKKRETEQLVLTQSRQQELLRNTLSGCENTKNSLKKKLEEEEKLQSKYGVYYDLVSAAEGKNSLRLVFEQYVLAYFFEDILRAANLRFEQMSNGRYRLERTKEIGDGRTKDNLEIEVHDFYTGKNRSVKTLSGGESFKASLSLALGMSDVIQKMSGGIRVETLFIDEGFGSLDAESLNQACETLSSLVGQDTFIGLISHVEELKERIRSQIIVTKSEQGSHVEVVQG